MGKTKFKILKKNIESYSRILFIAVFILFILSTIVTIDIFMKPINVENKTLENKILEKTNFSYKIQVIPCTLYPNGGVINSDGIIITKLTESIILDINSAVISDKPVSIKGTEEIMLIMCADKLWEKEYTLVQPIELRMDGTNNKITERQLIINVKDINNIVETIDKETGIRAEKYYLKIKPYRNGSIVYKGNTIPIDTSPEFVVEIRFNQFKVMENTEYKKEIPIENISVVKQDFNFGGRSVSLALARYIFAIFSFLFLIGTISIYKYKNPIKRGSVLSEIEKIDRKYKDRLIFLQGDINLFEKNPFKVKTFKSLLRIADEKELPILRVKNEDNSINYFVVDGDYIYTNLQENESIILNNG